LGIEQISLKFANRQAVLADRPLKITIALRSHAWRSRKVDFIGRQALAIKLGKRNRLWLNMRAARRSIELVEFIAILELSRGDPVRLFRESWEKPGQISAEGSR
jgi:hypothetical protein